MNKYTWRGISSHSYSAYCTMNMKAWKATPTNTVVATITPLQLVLVGETVRRYFCVVFSFLSLKPFFLYPPDGLLQVWCRCSLGRLCLVTQDSFAPPVLCVNTNVWPSVYFVLQQPAIFTFFRRLSPLVSCCKFWGLSFEKWVSPNILENLES